MIRQVRAAWVQAGISRPALMGFLGISVGFLIYVVGTIRRPPYGGLLVLAVAGLICLAGALFIRHPGRFLALFLFYAVCAPFFSRFVSFPLGWFKGMFFLAVLPVWILSRAALPGTSEWRRAVRLPLVTMLAAELVMALLALLSVLRGLDPVLVGDAWKAYLTAPPILFVAAEASEHPREVRSFLWWVLALTVLTAGGAIAQALIGIDLLARTGMNLGTGAVAFVSIDPVTGRFFQRVFSILDDQLALAAFSFCGIALSLLLAETTRRAGTRLLLLVLAGLNAYALLLTYNITVFLGTALFVFIHMCRKRSPRLLAGALILGLVVLGVAWLRYGDLVQNRLMTSFSVHSGVSTSLNSRLEANRQAWGMFRREPLVGGGLGSTASSMVYYRLGVRPDFIGGFATDNHYMTVALEAGLLGLAALLALHALPLWGLYRLRRRRLPGSGPFIAVAGSAVLVLLLMNFSNAPMNTNPSNLLFWILTGLIWRESARSPESPGKNLHDGARDEGGPLATDCLP